MARLRRDADPTAIGEQPALTTSSGTIWLVVAGIFTAIALVELAFMLTFGNPLVVVGLVLVAGQYLGILVTRFITPAGRLRLRIMAGLMLGIAGVSLIVVGVVAAERWSTIAG